MRWPDICYSVLSRLAFLAPLFAIAVPPVAAQTMPPGFVQYKHVRWSADDGAPEITTELVQTPDGYLWLGSDSLIRFDGVTFETIDWPAGSGRPHASPSGMLVSHSGELWIGLRGSGGVAVYRNGILQDMHAPEGPTIGSMAETADGTIWVASGTFGNRLKRLRAGHWEEVDERLGLPPGAIMNLVPTPDGGLWAALTHEGGESGELAYLARGAARFQVMPYRLSGRPKVALDPGGALWVSDAIGTRKLVGPDGKAAAAGTPFPAVPGLRTATIVFDRAGGLWGSTSSVGLFHVPNALALQGQPGIETRMFRQSDGLTSDISFDSLIDREGNLWVVTERGIDQFRRASAVQETAIPADPTHGLGIAAASDGSVYFVSQSNVYRVLPHGVPKPILKLAAADVAICPAYGDGIWITQPNRVVRIRGEQAEASPGYPGKALPTTCAEDRQGRLWLDLAEAGMVWRDANGWHEPKGALAQSHSWYMSGTGSGGVAFLTGKKLSTIDGDRFAQTDLSTTSIGGYSMIAADARDVFIAGSGGLMRVRGKQTALLGESRFPWITWFRALVQTPRGETWLIGRAGIVRLATKDLDRAFDDPNAPLPHTLFNTQDGLTSMAQHGGFVGTQAVAGGDGRVWFLNRNGAAYFDPETLEQNKLPPPVRIRSLTSSGTTYRDPATLKLPAGTRTLDIAYTALSLTVPERVRFRYRLEGVDASWVDPGARRMASYTNLGPGEYRFRVIAANNDGVWNETGATVQFEIPPTFVQSWIFKAMCVAAVLVLLWLAYSMRMHFVAGRIRLRMAERIEERERIARELHDTLLQSVQALTLRFQLAADDLPPKAPARPALIEAIDTADRVIAEGRDRVRELRSHQDSDIEQIVCDIVGRLAFAPSVNVSITTSGTLRVMDPLALEEVTRIAGEALFNIWRHAGAEHVIVEIRHGGAFTMRFADDGVGIDGDVAAQGGKTDHFGLPGMRERARKLRGNLVVRALPERGTEVVLTVPGSIAYKAGERSLFTRLWSL